MFHQDQTIGPYTLIKQLGKGGFGEVWLAERRSKLVTKKIAVKLPHEDQINIQAIKQEAKLWEQASGHANVLPIIDADIYEGQVVIVSEYASGGSLHDKLKTHGKFSVKEAVEMIIGVLNGLEFLHSKRIIHRDIKPANILFQGQTPRLMDFGISRVMQTSLQSSTIVGTNAYMSPEALDGKYSFQSDIWSVGVVLYHLLTGTLPFPQEHPTERMFAIVQKDFEPLTDDIPPEIQRIIKKSLEKLAENRYQTASLMREDLQHFLYGNFSTNPQRRPTEVLQDPLAPLINTSPEPSQPVSTDQNPAVKKIRVPFETNEAETIGQTPLITQPTRSKGNSLLLILMLVGGLIIGGIGTFFLVSTFTKNNSEVSSSKSDKSSNSTTTKKSEVDNSNSNSATETEIEETPTPTPKPTPVINIDGTWAVNFRFKDPNTPNYTGQTKFKIKKSGNTLFIEATNMHGEFYAEPNGKIVGNKVTIFLEEKGERVTYFGTISGNTMKGSIKAYYPGNWSAKKL